LCYFIIKPKSISNFSPINVSIQTTEKHLTKATVSLDLPIEEENVEAAKCLETINLQLSRKINKDVVRSLMDNRHSKTFIKEILMPLLKAHKPGTVKKLSDKVKLAGTNWKELKAKAMAEDYQIQEWYIQLREHEQQLLEALRLAQKDQGNL
jgi:hypothetical protein